MLPVTKPFLPPKEEYFELIEGVYERNWLTNDGPLVRELEQKLRSRFDHGHMSYVSNGTIALQLAIKALGLKGKIITTPFSYVATTSSIMWEGCEPVFVDIEPDGFNIDSSKIEAAITPDVTGIIATHCFGVPCDVHVIQKIADKHNLKVIYDAAHAFGTTVEGESIFHFGDVSTCSFHATKIFHTIEGGAVFCKDAETHQRIQYMRNFGHYGPEKFNGVGINGKNSEFHAAMGLVNLRYIDAILERRRAQCIQYFNQLTELPVRLLDPNDQAWNCSYFPVVFENEATCLEVMNALNAHNIFPRRYFYPSLNQINNWGAIDSCLVSQHTASCILCLPIFDEIKPEEVNQISNLIRTTFQQ
jgi:dTDP-4-amino-4,6-dideoxygalactose transaminase